MFKCSRKSLASVSGLARATAEAAAYQGAAGRGVVFIFEGFKLLNDMLRHKGREWIANETKPRRSPHVPSSRYGRKLREIRTSAQPLIQPILARAVLNTL